MGSSKYAAAWTYQDGIAHYRQRLRLSAYSINVGAVIEAGYVGENPEVAATLRRNGLGNVTIAELFSHLSHAMQNDNSHCQSSVSLVPSDTEHGLETMCWTNDKRFAHLRREAQVGKHKAGSAADDFVSALQSATTYRGHDMSFAEQSSSSWARYCHSELMKSIRRAVLTRTVLIPMSVSN